MTIHARALRLQYLRRIGLLLVLALSALLVVEREHLAGLREFGYPGLFLIGFFSSATVLLPAPGLALVFVSGDLLNPWMVGVVVGLGEALGELTGYMAGASGRARIKDRSRYERLATIMRRHGLFVVLLLSAIPNPAFDLAGIAAGALRYPVGRFLLACWGGKTVKAVLVALLGASASALALGRAPT